MTKFFTVIFLCALILCSCGTKAEINMTDSFLSKDKGAISQNNLPAPNTSFSKGIWLSQFDMKSIYLERGKQRSKESFTLLAADTLDNVKNMGFDTVYLQVHPYGDSFYASDYFPWSEYVSGSYSSSCDYDPFEIICGLCREKNLSLHAWINPLRLQTVEKAQLLCDDSPYTKLLKNTKGEICTFDGRYYFDPSYESVRELIANVARELVEKYPVDGVHIDDYFYPTQSSDFDKVGYQLYKDGGGDKKLDDFRRESVSLMVAEIYQAIKSADENAIFSISPAGNADNVYQCMYADVYRWCSEKGFCDVIIPQLYYGLKHEKCPFEQSLSHWEEICKGGEVKLYIGLTFSKVGLEQDVYAGTGRYEWARDKNILSKSLKCVLESQRVSGIAVFSYSYVISEQAKDEREGFLNLLQKT